MADEDTHYSSRYEEPTPEETFEELDWETPGNPPVEEAAALIFEILGDLDTADSRDLHALLNEVPPDFRPEVMATLLNRYVEQSASWPDEARSAREDQAADNRHTEGGTHDPPERGLHDTGERIAETLEYVTDIAGNTFARKLERAMEYSQNLPLRALNGNPATYGHYAQDTYLECAINLESTVAAREALSHEPWNDDQRREAVEHEVHRMAYRLNLEIQDRLITQFQDPRRMGRLARAMGLSQGVAEDLDELGQDMADDAVRARHLENPTSDDITNRANACLIHYAIENATQIRDETAVRELIPETLEPQEMAEKAQTSINHVDPALVNQIRDAAETATRWNDDEILDGAQDLHFEPTQLDILLSHAARATWLSSRPDRMLRSEVVSDCVTRALNEATGGENYGPIWEDLTESIQTLDPNRDADSGIPPPHHRAIYEKYGMQLVLDTNEISDHPMRKHLDLREIPAMLGHLFDDPENPLTYIAGTEHHAVAVVDGTVHDIFDSRDIGDRTLYLQDGRLTELWIRGADEATLAEARDIIEKYTEARRYDDVLTYGRTRRLTTSGTTWR